MKSKGKLIRIVIVVLLLLTVVVFFARAFRLDLKKHIPVPEMSDKEVSGLLEALRLPDTTKVSAMRVVFLKDGNSVRIAARVRIDRAQLDDVFQGSWMESHRVAASEFREYQMMLPPMYEINWWAVLPLRTEDERFYLSLEESPSGFIRAVIRKSESEVDLYFVRSSRSDYLPPIVLEAMRRGRSPDPGFPSQTHMYEVKKGKF